MITLKEMANEFVDFDNRVNVKELENETVTITRLGNMSTKFGDKDYAVLKDGRWFFLTTAFDILKSDDIEFPFTTKIIKKTSKTGNAYYTCNKESSQEYNNVKITDLVGKYIIIDDIKPITTRYGERYLINVIGETDSDYLVEDQVSYSVITNWESLYKKVKNVDLSEGLALHVILKKNANKTREYIWFE